MYTEELKLKVIEEFTKYPYYETISKKFGISENCVRKWTKDTNINVEQLEKEIPQIPYIPQPNYQVVDFNLLSNHDMYTPVTITEGEEKVENGKQVDVDVEFSLNGFNLKLKRQYLRMFLEELRND